MGDDNGNNNNILWDVEVKQMDKNYQKMVVKKLKELSQNTTFDIPAEPNATKYYRDALYDACQLIKSFPPMPPIITHEQAIDYLHKTGWLQNHDRILTENKIASPAPQKHGKWIWNGDTLDWERLHRCSECNKYALKDTDGKEVLSDFCPSCGADMRDSNLKLEYIGKDIKKVRPYDFIWDMYIDEFDDYKEEVERGKADGAD